jgi:hypothetical protein
MHEAPLAIVTVACCVLVRFFDGLFGDLEGLGPAIIITFCSVKNFLVTTMRDCTTFNSHIKFSLTCVGHHALDDFRIRS